MFGRTRRTLLWAAVFALLAGCGGGTKSASVPQMPATSNLAHGPRTAQSTTVGTGLFVPNSVKYADKGTHPATGMSGSASIQSRALLGKDGHTFVEATTGTLDSTPGPGTIKNVSLTPVTPDGVSQKSYAYSGTDLSGGSYWSKSYTGFARNMALQLQNGVVGIDPRTDVVQTAPLVKLRPDLAVKSVNGPSSTYKNALTDFSASVTEVNGDIGARADCVLSIDGVPVDTSHGIWVDAGSAVSCIFRTQFSTTGVHTVQIAAANVVPGDWDTSNNAARTTITVVNPTIPLSYSVRAQNVVYQGNYNGTWTSTVAAIPASFTASETTADASIYGFTDKIFQFPLKQLNASVNFDATTSLQANPTALTANYNDPYQTCVLNYAPGQDQTVCTFPGSGSFAYVEWFYYAVEYYSRQSCHCGVDSFVADLAANANATVGTPFDIGSVDHFALSIVDGSGTQYGLDSGPIPTTPFVYSYSYPFGFSVYDGWFGGNYTSSISGSSVSASSP